MKGFSLKQLAADLALLAVACVWGTTFQLVHDALRYIDTVPFLAIRFLIAVLILIPFHRGPWRWHRSGLFAGVCLLGGYVTQTFGLVWTTPAKAAFITGFYVVLVPLITSIRSRKVPEWGIGVGAILALAGLGMITLEGSFIPGKGDLLALACALFFALQIIAVDDSLKHLPVSDLTLIQMGLVSIFNFGVWGVAGGRIAWNGPVLWAILITSVLATAAAFLIQGWAQQFTSSTKTAIIFSGEPVFASVYSYFFGGETFTPQKLIGCALVFAGIIAGVLINHSKSRREEVPSLSVGGNNLAHEEMK